MTQLEFLTEPKNSVIKQYQYLFSLDNVDLIFEKDALVEIARESIKRKTGARGLRSIIEELLLDVMYDIPSKENIKTCTITRENVLNKTKPSLLNPAPRNGETKICNQCN